MQVGSPDDAASGLLESALATAAPAQIVTIVSPERLHSWALLGVLTLVLLTAAAIVRLWIAPATMMLGTAYQSTTVFAATDSFREAADAPWEPAAKRFVRTDQAITDGATVLIQGEVRVFAESGEVVFENVGQYRVDAATRENVDGGNEGRRGQFLFPPGVLPTTYTLWDPMYIGPRLATYRTTEHRDGLELYVFDFLGEGMDETAGYGHLPDVPERYRALTDGRGTLRVEPISGIVVDYAEAGRSYFVNPATGARVADFYTWSGEFTAATRREQEALAQATIASSRLFFWWIPAGLTAGAAASAIATALARRGG